MTSKQNNTKEILTIAVKLLIICSIVAVIIAFVYSITKDKIAFNEKVKTSEALSEIYSADFNEKKFEVNGNGEYVITDNGETLATCVSVNFTPIDKAVTGLFVLTDNEGTCLGYCVSIEPMGFKDVIKMLVAVNSDMSIKGVKIVSMSETSGYGTRAKDDPNPPAGKQGNDWFLRQFDGLNINGFAKNSKNKYESIDTISGATKTSQPVAEAVEIALNQVIAFNEYAGGETNE